MSNVLIGIIGVILFIGLALAGALYFGPQFDNAANNSKAVAYVAAVDQIVRAAALYRNDTGDYPSQTWAESQNGLHSGTTAYSQLVGQGYLKAIPQNPLGDTTTATSSPWHIVEWYGAGTKTLIVDMPMPNERNPDICKLINSQVRGTPTDSIEPRDGNMGCQAYSYGAGYRVWARLD